MTDGELAALVIKMTMEKLHRNGQGWLSPAGLADLRADIERDTNRHMADELARVQPLASAANRFLLDESSARMARMGKV